MVEVNNMAKQYKVYIVVSHTNNYFKEAGVFTGIQNARKHAMAFCKKSITGGCMVSEVLSPTQNKRIVGSVWLHEKFEWETVDGKYYILHKDGSLGKRTKPQWAN